MTQQMKWSYGLTTIPDRFSDYLPRTMESLAKAGFDKPRIFVDGKCPHPPRCIDGLSITQRWDPVGPYCNWVCAAWELYCAEPAADRYAIFQDDLVTYPSLREYLERTPYPEDGYLNLYTFPANEKPEHGFYHSNQMGKGALCLIFDGPTLRLLLEQGHMVRRVSDVKRGKKSIDGAVVTALKGLRSEYVHNPSLVQHIGLRSGIGHKQFPKAMTFRGEDFNALELLKG